MSMPAQSSAAPRPVIRPSTNDGNDHAVCTSSDSPAFERISPPAAPDAHDDRRQDCASLSPAPKAWLRQVRAAFGGRARCRYERREGPLPHRPARLTGPHSDLAAGPARRQGPSFAALAARAAEGGRAGRDAPPGRGLGHPAADQPARCPTERRGGAGQGAGAAAGEGERGDLRTRQLRHGRARHPPGLPARLPARGRHTGVRCRGGGHRAPRRAVAGAHGGGFRTRGTGAHQRRRGLVRCGGAAGGRGAHRPGAQTPHRLHLPATGRYRHGALAAAAGRRRKFLHETRRGRRLPWRT